MPARKEIKHRKSDDLRKNRIQPYGAFCHSNGVKEINDTYTEGKQKIGYENRYLSHA